MFQKIVNGFKWTLVMAYIQAKKIRPVRLTRCVTAKRSPLNNRVVRSTPGGDVCADIDPEGVAHLCRWGTLSECIRSVPTSAGPSDTAVIERRRFQRHFNRTARKLSKYAHIQRAEKEPA